MRRTFVFIRAGLWSIHQLRDGHFHDVLMRSTSNNNDGDKQKAFFKSDFQYQIFFCFHARVTWDVITVVFTTFLVTVFGKVLTFLKTIFISKAVIIYSPIDFLVLAYQNDRKASLCLPFINTTLITPKSQAI